MKYIIFFILVILFVFYCYKSKEKFDSIVDVLVKDNISKPPLQLKQFYGTPPDGGPYITVPKKNCYAKENKLICDEKVVEKNQIMINIGELGIVKNKFIIKYCSIHNFLINTGTSIKINSDVLEKNYLKLNDSKYFLISMEWKKSNIADYKLQLHLIHKNKINNEIHIVVPLKYNKDTNLINPMGVNNIIHHYDYIPDLNYDSGNIGKFISVNLKELIPIFNISTLRYIKMNDKEEWFITKNQLFDMLTCDKIYNKIIRMNE
jgi:hypothetical protein